MDAIFAAGAVSLESLHGRLEFTSGDGSVCTVHFVHARGSFPFTAHLGIVFEEYRGFSSLCVFTVDPAVKIGTSGSADRLDLLECHAILRVEGVAEFSPPRFSLLGDEDLAIATCLNVFLDLPLPVELITLSGGF